MATTIERKVIQIDEEKCDGCGLCVNACHEGALALVDGKAKLTRDDYCDGLGDCIGECPQDAITFVVRQAAPYDEEAVKENMARSKPAGGSCPSVAAMIEALHGAKTPCACPSAQAREIRPEDPSPNPMAEVPSSLRNWPTQLALVPPNAAYLQGADLLISADCVPFAYGAFHSDLVPGKVVLQACPKLDDTAPYIDKLAAIFADSGINSVTLARMEVPCCGGLVMVVKQALAQAQADVPVEVVTVGIDGDIHDRERVD